MSGAKFSPEPWEVCWDWNEEPELAMHLVCSDDAGVALVYAGTEAHHGERGDANARLIAAAPEMYELLRRSARQLDADYPLDATRIMGVLARIDGDDS